MNNNESNTATGSRPQHGDTDTVKMLKFSHGDKFDGDFFYILVFSEAGKVTHAIPTGVDVMVFEDDTYEYFGNAQVSKGSEATLWLFRYDEDAKTVQEMLKDDSQALRDSMAEYDWLRRTGQI